MFRWLNSFCVLREQEDDYVSCVIDEKAANPPTDVRPDPNKSSSPPPPPPILNPPGDEQPLIPVTVVKQEPSSVESADGRDRPADETARYCKTCDITFNYLSTFIAHQKYYCRNSVEMKRKEANANVATVTS